ncbi:hypothetical protein DAI22_12g075100 [Oryza sativa Japonica Group]|nr:hypothetical protein DAI22_12g075100 [Oryza sativa Japonica Group]
MTDVVQLLLVMKNEWMTNADPRCKLIHRVARVYIGRHRARHKLLRFISD